MQDYEQHQIYFNSGEYLDLVVTLCEHDLGFVMCCSNFACQHLQYLHRALAQTSCKDDEAFPVHISLGRLPRVWGHMSEVLSGSRTIHNTRLHNHELCHAVTVAGSDQSKVPAVCKCIIINKTIFCNSK